MSANKVKPELIQENSTHRFVTEAEKTAISNVSGVNSGDETVTSVGTLINGATEKTTPVDADQLTLMDSADSNVLKKLSWTNLKATLKAYFDTLYNNYVHPVSHDPSIITQDETNRFVTDLEKITWNEKQNALGYIPEDTANKDEPNGYVGLDNDARIPADKLPINPTPFHRVPHIGILPAGNTMIQLPWTYSPIVKNIAVFLSGVKQNNDSLIFTNETTVHLASSFTEDVPYEITSTFVIYQSYSDGLAPTEVGTLTSGQDTIDLPWEYDNINKSVFVYINGIKKNINELIFSNPNQVKLVTPVASTVTYEVVPTVIMQEVLDHENIDSNVRAFGTVTTETPFYFNNNTVYTDTTITADKNAMSAGPITIAPEVTITIAEGAEWVIV